MTTNTDPVRALIGEMTEYLDQQVDPELDVIAKWRDRLESALAYAPPSAPVGVDEVRPDYRPAFDLPTTAAEALAWLTQQGDPTCMTFSAAKAKRAAELLGAALQQTGTDPVTAEALAELNRAVQKFPTWPTDPLHAVAVLGEEFGELTKAVLQSVYEPHKVKPGDVRTEAVQVAAMALRFLRSLHSYEFTPGAQHEQPALAQQPAAPSGEAVAWVTRGSKRAHVRWFGAHEQSIPHGTKLYAAPQQPAGVLSDGISDDVIKAIWRAAMTSAHNVCVNRSNRWNDEDGPDDRITEANECAKEIAHWLEADEGFIAEIRAMLAAQQQGGA